MYVASTISERHFVDLVFGIKKLFFLKNPIAKLSAGGYEKMSGVYTSHKPAHVKST